MPIGEIVAEGVVGIFRMGGRILFEIVFEWMVKGAGYVVMRIARPKKAPSEAACAMAGLAAWGVVGCIAYFLYRAVASE